MYKSDANILHDVVTTVVRSVYVDSELLQLRDVRRKKRECSKNDKQSDNTSSLLRIASLELPTIADLIYVLVAVL